MLNQWSLSHFVGTAGHLLDGNGAFRRENRSYHTSSHCGSISDADTYFADSDFFALSLLLRYRHVPPTKVSATQSDQYPRLLCLRFALSLSSSTHRIVRKFVGTRTIDIRVALARHYVERTDTSHPHEPVVDASHSRV